MSVIFIFDKWLTTWQYDFKAFLDVQGARWTYKYVQWGRLQLVFHKEEECPHHCTFKIPDFLEDDLNRTEKPGDVSGSETSSIWNLTCSPRRCVVFAVGLSNCHRSVETCRTSDNFDDLGLSDSVRWPVQWRLPIVLKNGDIFGGACWIINDCGCSLAPKTCKNRCCRSRNVRQIPVLRSSCNTTSCRDDKRYNRALSGTQRATEFSMNLFTGAPCPFIVLGLETVTDTFYISSV